MAAPASPGTTAPQVAADQSPGLYDRAKAFAGNFNPYNGHQAVCRVAGQALQSIFAYYALQSGVVYSAAAFALMSAANADNSTNYVEGAKEAANHFADALLLIGGMSLWAKYAGKGNMLQQVTGFAQNLAKVPADFMALSNVWKVGVGTAVVATPLFVRYRAPEFLTTYNRRAVQQTVAWVNPMSYGAVQRGVESVKAGAAKVWSYLPFVGGSEAGGAGGADSDADSEGGAIE